MYHSKGDGNFSSSFDTLTMGSTSNIISAEVPIGLAFIVLGAVATAMPGKPSAASDFFVGNVLKTLVLCGGFVL